MKSEILFRASVAMISIAALLFLIVWTFVFGAQSFPEIAESGKHPNILIGLKMLGIPIGVGVLVMRVTAPPQC